jgi:hypothetical protein
VYPAVPSLQTRPSVEAVRDGFKVTFSRVDGQLRFGQFNEVVVRHGPEGIIDQLLPENAVKYLRTMWSSSEDPTVQQMWQDDFFPKVEPIPLVTPTEITEMAVRHFKSAFSGLDHGIGHMASMSPEKNERLTSSKD